jgi:parallel beta-helix repeat protein
MRKALGSRSAAQPRRSLIHATARPIEELEARLLFATYFVDFETGSNTNNGLSITTPFKHAPGDSQATGAAKTTALVAGDVVRFKGGVVYRGTINVNASGAAGNPIIFDGNFDGSWGTGKAIIDGREALTGWTQATSTEVDGNANWSNIYWTWVPAGTSILEAGVFENGQRLFLAKNPNPTDTFWLDNIDDFADADSFTRTTITDAALLNQADPNYWSGPTQVIFRAGNNAFMMKPITGFNPSLDQISFADPGSNLYGEFAMANSFRVLDMPGEYVIRTDRTDGAGNVKMYIMPLTSGISGKTFEVAKRQNAFHLGQRSNVTINGFIMQGTAYSSAGGHINTSTNSGSTGLTITNNIMRYGGAMGVRLHGSSNAVVSNNEVYENRNRGIFASGSTAAGAPVVTNVTVSNNIVNKNGATGIGMYVATNSQITSNIVTNHNGHHANGITIYISSNNVMVRGNYVSGRYVAFTTQNSNNIAVAYNVLLTKDAYSYASWAGTSNGLYTYNNVMLGGYMTINSTSTNVVSRNNIVAGSNVVNKGGTASNNIYVALMPSQYQDPYGGSTGSIYQPDLNQIFVNPTAGDYHLKSTSPAIDAGVAIAGLTYDHDGTSVPLGGAVDIGAFEYIPATPATLAPTHDAQVRGDMYNGGNYGTSNLMDVRMHSNPADGRNRQAYITFDLSSVAAITNGTIRLYQPANTFTGSVGISVYAVPDTTWDESTLTWQNKPAPSGSALATTTVTQGSSTGTWYEWDVTAYLQAEKAAGRNLVSFVFIATTDIGTPVRFSTKEASGTTYDPQLLLNT